MEVLQVHQATHSPTSTLQIISQSFNVVNHVVIGLVAIYMTWISIRADAKPMTWHAWSCTIGVSFTTLSTHTADNICRTINDKRKCFFFKSFL